MYQTGKVRLYKPAVITVVPPHNITDQEIKAGESLTLAIEQAPNRTYQWFKNNKFIEGANLPNLKLENTQAKDTGLYSLKVISQSGETSKFEANINVLSPPVITAEPISLAFIEGGTFKLDTTVTGTEPLSFQWYRDGEAIDGANSNYFRSVKGGSIPGNYKLIIKNEYGSVESREVQITEGSGIEIKIGNEGRRQITLKAKSNEGNWMIEFSYNLFNWIELGKPSAWKSIIDTRDDAEILLEQHTAKHGGFGIRTWSAEKGNLKSFDETKGQYEILSPAVFAERFDLDYPIKQFYRARLIE